MQDLTMSTINEIFRVERIQMPIRFDEVMTEYGSFRIYRGSDYWWTRSVSAEYGDIAFGVMDDVKHRSWSRFPKGVLCVCRI